MGRLALYSFFAAALWLILHDRKRRSGISLALWIPTLWALISLSRPVSFWLGFGGAQDTLEGSPIDSLVYGSLIFLAFCVLTRRGLHWSRVVPDNWPIFLLYGYLLISVFWADSTFVSLKRWVKESGNIAVALVVLTETNPLQAMRAIFTRCSYFVIPLSVLFIRYFPELGRRYSIHSGGMEAVGVTDQKNSLGGMVLVCGIVLIWDWIEQSRSQDNKPSFIDKSVWVLLLAMGGWLLHICDSKTSITCLTLASATLVAFRLPVVRNHVKAFGSYATTALCCFLALDYVFGIKASLTGLLGRDPTLTGRTNVWHELLELHTNPIFGTGFCSIWDNSRYIERLPDWVHGSAHNGYLETYLDGGYLGVSLLILMLLSLAIRFNKRLADGGYYPLVRFVVLLVIAIAACSESMFGRMGALAFLFLVTSIERPTRDSEDEMDDKTDFLRHPIMEGSQPLVPD